MEEKIKKLTNKMRKIAKKNGVSCTENLEKIAKARVMLGISLDICPCDRGGDRGCISETCREEIEKFGICHCRCFKKGE